MLGGGASDVIKVHKKDNFHEAALKFCLKHRLDIDLVDALSQTIQENFTQNTAPPAPPPSHPQNPHFSPPLTQPRSNHLQTLEKELLTELSEHRISHTTENAVDLERISLPKSRFSEFSESDTYGKTDRLFKMSHNVGENTLENTVSVDEEFCEENSEIFTHNHLHYKKIVDLDNFQDPENLPNTDPHHEYAQITHFPPDNYAQNSVFASQTHDLAPEEPKNGQKSRQFLFEHDKNIDFSPHAARTTQKTAEFSHTHEIGSPASPQKSRFRESRPSAGFRDPGSIKSQ